MQNYNRPFQGPSNNNSNYGPRRRFGNPSFGNNPNGFRNRPSKKKSLTERIDISKFVQKATVSTPENTAEITNTFFDFNFCEPLRYNLKRRNYLTPTPIQDQSIKHIIEGKDIVGLANTGTGKTAAFLLPLIHKVFHNRSQKVLIIAPTRELAQQIEEEFKQFSSGMKIFSAICVGGASMFKQIGQLRGRPNFVIGTPGRLKDLSKRNFFNLSEFQNIVLDEVDRMLDMGFIEDIKLIISQLPKVKQTLFFSATMPPKINTLVSQFLHDPITVEVKTGETTKNVEQDIISVRHSGAKFGQLQDLLNKEEIKKALIFIETKREVDKITKSLVESGYKVDSIHGDKRQSQRQRALSQFKNSSINILVATDVAARGLDVKDISHVINYTIPNTYNDYVHRIGRTGRCERKGFAYTFVEQR